MELKSFQKRAVQTDAIDWEAKHGSEIVLLGMLGELGSVAGVFKKGQRDGDAYSGFKRDLFEELGDLLWYVVVTAHRLGMEVDYAPQNNANSDLYKTIYKAADNINKLVTFDCIQTRLINGSKDKVSEAENLIYRIVSDIHTLAVHFDTDIYNIADLNASKTPSFFKGDQSAPAHQFDLGLPDYEVMPRKFEIDFIEAGEGKSIMQMNGVNVGDKLTDNSYKDDGYRFHDIFHLANVATLGWSPVLRRMLHRKRKSDPDKDEKEDGARAAIVEELVVNLIFNYAEENSFLERSRSVDIGVLKQILKLVKGIEVEKLEAWEWKHCIKEGCRVFREIRSDKLGKVFIDSDKRSITFRKA